MPNYHIRHALRERSLRYEEKCRSLNERTIAKQLVEDMTEEDLRDLAIETIVEWIWSARRLRQLEVERAAEREATQVSAAEAERAQAARFQRAYEDPIILASQETAPYFPNKLVRHAFKKWCGERYPEWHARAHEVVASADINEEQRELFFEDWHPGGVHAAQRELFRVEVFQIMKEYAQRIRLEITQELLDSIFATGDGRRVTWGQATVADHEQRVALLTRNVTANAEAAARHMTAVEMIKAAGVERLADLQMVGMR